MLCFFTDIKGLNNVDRIQQYQNRLLDALMLYTSSHYPNLPTKFGELLLRLSEVQRWVAWCTLWEEKFSMIMQVLLMGCFIINHVSVAMPVVLTNRECWQHSHNAIFNWNFEKCSVKIMLLLTECVWDFYNNASWDTHYNMPH